jgi:Glyoxalase-like domain
VTSVHSYIKNVTFDCADALVVARFWAAALGTDMDEDSTAEKAYVEAAGWGGPNMWFNRVPEPKTAKNRMHLDLRAPGSIADEVERLKGLGAGVVRVDDGLTVMADPEGNEFCVE